jgi:hypothetical protein
MMRKNQTIRAWFFAFFLLSYLMFYNTALGDMKSRSSSELDYGFLSGVCALDSNGIEEAAVYIGEGPHPVVLLDNQEADKHEWNDSLTSDWQPEAISTTQLVGCIEDENELIETCNYEGGRLVKRYIRHLNIDLHEAHNGKKIGFHEFIGGVPDICHLTETFYEWQYVKVKYGSRVTFEEVEIWLTDYVNASISAVKSMPWVPLLLLEEDNSLPQPGSWSGTAGFGELSFTVDSTSTSITQLVINYTDFSCGGVLSNGTITVTSSWPVSDRQFNITTGSPDREITISGTFDITGEYASGTYDAGFNGTTCSGTWDAIPN